MTFLIQGQSLSIYSNWDVSRYFGLRSLHTLRTFIAVAVSRANRWVSFVASYNCLWRRFLVCSDYCLQYPLRINAAKWTMGESALSIWSLNAYIRLRKKQLITSDNVLWKRAKETVKNNPNKYCAENALVLYRIMSMNGSITNPITDMLLTDSNIFVKENTKRSYLLTSIGKILMGKLGVNNACS